MIDKLRSFVKNIIALNYRNLVQDDINFKLSNQNDLLIQKMYDLENAINTTQESIHEIKLRIPDVIELDVNFEHLLVQIRELIKPHKYRITKLEFFGNEFDGGYFISSEYGKKINLISIGIGDNYSFDLEVAKRGGIIHMYDGTIEKIQGLPQNMMFVGKNVGNNVLNREIDLTSVVNNFLNTLKSFDDVNVIKMDTEGSEWEIFNKFDFSITKNFNSLVIEFHNINEMLRTREQQKQMIDTLTNINNYFMPVYFSPNNWSQVIKSGYHSLPNVFEIVYVNRSKHETENISIHESAHIYDKPKNNPFRPSLGKFFI